MSITKFVSFTLICETTFECICAVFCLIQGLFNIWSLFSFLALLHQGSYLVGVKNILVLHILLWIMISFCEHDGVCNCFSVKVVEFLFNKDINISGVCLNVGIKYFGK